MSKILFVNHAYSFPSGWGTAAVDYALAMNCAGLDIVSRSIRLNNSNPQLPEEFLKLEEKSNVDCDICIQHLLPHHLKFGNFKRNIALCVYESGGTWLNSWSSKVNMMDELWVPSLYTKKCFIEGGVKIPIKIVPHTFDMAKYNKLYEKINHPQLDGNYIFYTVADANVRKNLSKIIQAFHLEFSVNEPVSLVIKTGKFGADAQQLFEAIKNDCSQIKEHMKLYTNHNMYKDEFIITDNMTDEQIMSIHNTGHCYVNASHGEAWCTLPSTLVDTEYGQKEIQNVTTEDRVYSHTGRLRKVTKLINRDFVGELIKIVPLGYPKGLLFTPNHMHYVVQRRNTHLIKDVVIEPKFMKSEDISQGDFWVAPKIRLDKVYKTIKISDFIDVDVSDDGYIDSKHSNNSKPNTSLKNIADACGTTFKYVHKILKDDKINSELAKKIRAEAKNRNYIVEKIRIKNEIELTPDFMFFIGHYIAEGYGSASSVGLCTHIDEKYGQDISLRVINDVFGLKSSVRLCGKNKRCLRINFCNHIISKFLRELCGIGARNKKIHSYLKQSENRECIIKGIYYGDGGFTTEKYSFSTSSERLTRDIYEVCLSDDIYMYIRRNERKDKGGSCEYIVDCCKFHDERFYNAYQPVKYNTECITIPASRHHLSLLEDDKNFYLPIKSVDRVSYSGKVYNISVDVDESYTCSGYATHNCIPLYDAMAFGKTIVAPNNMYDYLADGCFFGFDTYEDCNLRCNDTFRELGSSRETWRECSAIDIGKCMRKAYNKDTKKIVQTDLYNDMNSLNLVRAKEYSYEKIGNLIKGLLDV